MFYNHIYEICREAMKVSVQHNSVNFIFLNNTFRVIVGSLLSVRTSPHCDELYENRDFLFQTPILEHRTITTDFKC